MNMWLEDLTEDHFRVCLREVKTFDGKDDNLKVVSNFILPLNVMRNSERPLPRNYLIRNFEISSTISHPQNASQLSGLNRKVQQTFTSLLIGYYME